MNAVVRIVLGLSALALVSGCAVSTAPSDDEQGSSANALSGALESPTEGDGTPSKTGSDIIRLPEHNTKAAIVAPGTANAAPTDPSPWKGDGKH